MLLERDGIDAWSCHEGVDVSGDGNNEWMPKGCEGRYFTYAALAGRVEDFAPGFCAESGC